MRRLKVSPHRPKSMGKSARVFYTRSSKKSADESFVSCGLEACRHNRPINGYGRADCRALRQWRPGADWYLLWVFDVKRNVW